MSGAIRSHAKPRIDWSRFVLGLPPVQTPGAIVTAWRLESRRGDRRDGDPSHQSVLTGVEPRTSRVGGIPPDGSEKQDAPLADARSYESEGQRD